MNMTWGFTGRPATLDDIKACVGTGWGELLTKLVTDLETLGWSGTIFQVKEKFGGLRFYIGQGSDAIFARIAQAENESLRVCEECGAPGKPNGRGWVKTLCKGCDERIYLKEGEVIEETI
jgi:hypothetical protein